MDPQNSYEAKVKALAQAKTRRENTFYLSLFARMTLDEAIIRRKENELRNLINQSLDDRDCDAFMNHAKKYVDLIR